MLNNFKKLIRSMGASFSLETTYISTTGVSSKCYSNVTHRTVQNFVQLYNLQGPYMSLQDVPSSYAAIVLGTGTKSVSEEDYYITPLATTYPSISSWWTGQQVATERTHNSDGSLNTLYKIAFIGQNTFNISELGIVILGTSSSSSASTRILLDRVTFPTIQVTPGKSVVINYNVKSYIHMNVPEE